MFLASQILAAIALILDLTSFQFKKREHILMCLGVSCILHGTHFYLLDKHTACVLSIIAALRAFISCSSTSRNWMYLFLILVFSTAYFTYDGLLTVLATTGSTLSTIGTFRSNDFALRLFKVPSTMCWIVHNILVPTPVGIAIEVLFLSSNLVGFYRFYPLKRVKPLDSSPSTDENSLFN